jgi:CRISPR/Cas system Type II protein with McrA/HNH and RuvC-like nuclease domain
VLKHQELTCIFSQKPIIKSDLSLDHFLPWSFIGHDQLWNLIPISKSVNSSKSDNIPSMDKYLDKFIELQIQGLQISNQNMAESKWENQVDDFVTGLNVNFLDLTNNKKVVTEKYQEIILPLASIAHNMGFSSNWEC